MKKRAKIHFIGKIKMGRLSIAQLNRLEEYKDRGRNTGLRGNLPKTKEAQANFRKFCQRCPFCYEKKCKHI